VADLSVAVEIAGSESVSDDAAKAARSLDAIGESAQKSTGFLSNMASTAAGFVVSTALTQLPGMLTDMAKSAVEDEKATLRLQQTIKNLGGDVEGNTANLNERIKVGQRLAFTDDDIRDSYNNLAIATQDSDEALRRQSIAMDISRAKGIPLAQVSTMLGKLTEDNINVFRRMGITIQSGATEAEALAEIQKRFAGQADEYAQSTAGQFEQAQIAFDEAKESLGAALLPAIAAVGMALADALPYIQDWAGEFSEIAGPILGGLMSGITAFVPAVSEMAGALGDMFLPVLDDVSDMFSVDLPEAMRILTNAWHTVGQVFQHDWQPDDTIDPFVNAIGTLAIVMRDQVLPVLVTAWNTIERTVQHAVDVIGPIVGTLAAVILENWVSTGQAILDAVSIAWPAISGMIGATLTMLNTMTNDTLDGIADLWDQFADRITSVVDGAYGMVRQIIVGTGEIIARFWETNGQKIMTTWETVWNGVKTVAELIIPPMIDALLSLFEGVITWFDANWPLIQATITTVLNAIVTVTTTTIAILQQIWTDYGDAITLIVGGAFEIVKGIITVALQLIGGIITTAMQIITGDWSGAWQTIQTTLGNVFTTITDTIVPGFLSIFQGLWAAFYQAFLADAVTQWQAFADTIAGYLNGIITGVQTFVDMVWGIFQSGYEGIVGGTQAYLDQLGGVIQSGLQAIGSWISSQVSSWSEWGAGLANALVEAVKNTLNGAVDAMLAPIRQTLEKGQQLIQGFSFGQKGASNAPAGSEESQWAQIAQEEGVDPALLRSLIQQESGGKQSARSGVGAIGLTQLMPSTAASLGVDPNDPLQNVRGGARYLKQMLDMFGGDEQRALIAYNAGPGGGTPAESIAYAQRVTSGAGQFRVPQGVVNAQRQMTPQVGQFSLQGDSLTASEAAAFCGPAAAMWFANIYGRMPSKEEAEAMARQVGWTPEQGMAGPGSEQQLMGMMGVPTNIDFTPTEQEVADLAARNVPFALSTPGHYYQVQGGDLGGLNVGASGTALRQGAATMSLAEIQRISGSMQALITIQGQYGDVATASWQSSSAGASDTADAVQEPIQPTQQLSRATSDLTKQYQAGEISAQDYVQGVSDLEQQLGSNTDVTQDAMAGTQAFGRAVIDTAAATANSAVPAVSEMSGMILDLTGSMGETIPTTAELATRMTEVAASTGLTSEPLTQLEAGMISSGSAINDVVASLAASDPQWAALYDQLQTNTGGTEEFAQALMQELVSGSLPAINTGVRTTAQTINSQFTDTAIPDAQSAVSAFASSMDSTLTDGALPEAGTAFTAFGSTADTVTGDVQTNLSETASAAGSFQGSVSSSFSAAETNIDTSTAGIGVAVDGMATDVASNATESSTAMGAMSTSIAGSATAVSTSVGTMSGSVDTSTDVVTGSFAALSNSVGADTGEVISSVNTMGVRTNSTAGGMYNSVQAIVNAFSTGVGQIVEVLNQLPNRIVEAMNAAKQTGEAQGQQAGEGIAHGMQTGLQQSTDEIGNSVESAIHTASQDSKNALEQVGEELGHGVGTGFSQSQEWMEQTFENVLQEAVDNAAEGVEVASPSKLTERMIGVPLAQGVVMGWQREFAKNPLAVPMPTFDDPMYGGASPAAVGAGATTQYFSLQQEMHANVDERRVQYLTERGMRKVLTDWMYNA